MLKFRVKHEKKIKLLQYFQPNPDTLHEKKKVATSSSVLPRDNFDKESSEDKQWKINWMNAYQTTHDQYSKIKDELESELFGQRNEIDRLKISVQTQKSIIQDQRKEILKQKATLREFTSSERTKTPLATKMEVGTQTVIDPCSTMAEKSTETDDVAMDVESIETDNLSIIEDSTKTEPVNAQKQTIDDHNYAKTQQTFPNIRFFSCANCNYVAKKINHLKTHQNEHCRS